MSRVTKKLKGREPLTMQIRSEQKRQLEQIKEQQRDSINPNASMTLVVEQLVAKEHRRLKL